MARRRKSAVVAPPPDRISGEPRPPDAPRRYGGGATPTGYQPENSPGVPDGYGPVLEWSQITRKDRWYFVGFVIIAFVVLGFINTGWGWLIDWPKMGWMWLLCVILCGFVWWRTSDDWIAVGADWVQHGRIFVDTYHLTRIATTSAGAYPALVLEDDENRIVTLSLGICQRNAKMWNLIYNGIATSIADGTCDISPKAREFLYLPDDFGKSGTPEKRRMFWAYIGGVSMMALGVTIIPMAINTNEKLPVVAGIGIIFMSIAVIWKTRLDYLGQKRLDARRKR